MGSASAQGDAALLAGVGWREIGRDFYGAPFNHFIRLETFFVRFFIDIITFVFYNMYMIVEYMVYARLYFFTKDKKSCNN